MTFLNRFFGGKKSLSEEEQRELATSLLRETETLMLENPKKALSTLRRKSTPAYEILRIGGSMHDEFRDTVERIFSRQNESEFLSSSEVEVVSWERWPEPTVKDVVECAQEMERGVLYLVPPMKRNPRDAVAELDALREFNDPQVAMVVLGEEGMFLRRDFILEAGDRLDAGSEEIGQDFMDQAKALGLKARVIVA